MYTSQTLDTIRKKIDAIDSATHDLLMERAALASSIAAEKKQRGMKIVHPAREARMIRRLLARHHGALPKEAIARIWRELVGAVSMLQSGLTAQFYCETPNIENLKIITDYFGSVLPVQQVSSAQDAVNAVAASQCDFASVPWPTEGCTPSIAAWLPDLIDLVEQDRASGGTELPLNIVQSLPFVCPKGTESSRQYITLTRANFEPSEDDCSFIALKSQHPFDAQDALTQAGLKIHSTVNMSTELYHYLFVGFEGFVDIDSEVIKTIRKDLNPDIKLLTMGGYPKPIIL
jgi:chorismate mutase/prephenate dehydratase